MSHLVRRTPSTRDGIWRSSSYSGAQGNCVEVADDIPGIVPVRDSKCPAGPALAFPSATWDAFLERLRSDSRRPSVPLPAVAVEVRSPSGPCHVRMDTVTVR